MWVSSSGQIDSIIYGLSYSFYTNDIYLASINPESGQVTNISASPVNQSMSYINGSTLNPHKAIYSTTTDSLILGFDIQSGEMVYSTELIHYQNLSFAGMTYNCFDTTYYGLSYNNSLQEVFLSTINPQIGQVNPVSTNPILTTCSPSWGKTIDPYQNIFYFLTQGFPPIYLIGLDLSTGDMVTNVQCILPEGTYTFSSILYNCSDSIIYGICRIISGGAKFSKIDPASGNITYISDTAILAVNDRPPTLDPYGGIYYLNALDSTFTGIDIHSGQISTKVQVILPSGSNIFMMPVFNHSCFFDPPVYLPQVKSNPNLHIYPNPAYQRINIEFNEPKNFSVKVFDVAGRIYFQSQRFNTTIYTLELSNYIQGCYMLQISNGENSWWEKFYVIE